MDDDDDVFMKRPASQWKPLFTDTSASENTQVAAVPETTLQRAGTTSVAALRQSLVHH